MIIKVYQEIMFLNIWNGVNKIEAKLNNIQK
jgi:hypothetical protein